MRAMSRSSDQHHIDEKTSGTTLPGQDVNGLMPSEVMMRVEELSLTTTIIQPRKGLWDLDLKSLWEYRELLYFLVWRDVKVRYKQTALGVAWAVLQPLMATFIFSIFFGRLARIPRTERRILCLPWWGNTGYGAPSDGIRASRSAVSCVCHGGVGSVADTGY